MKDNCYFRRTLDLLTGMAASVTRSCLVRDTKTLLLG